MDAINHKVFLWKNISIGILLIILFGCKNENQTIDVYKESNKITKPLIDSTNRFISEVRIDTSLKPLGKVVDLELSNGKRKETVFAICSCQKDKKNNTIKIQIRSGIPTKKEMDSTGITDKSGGRLNHLMDLGYLKKIDGRFQFLTFFLKDSILTQLEMYSKSTEPEYNGSDFKSMDIDRYKIAISTFDYSIASAVYGNFELRLPKDFGYFDNDTILKGHFECNNWKIATKDEIQKWEINKIYPQQIE